MFGKSKYIKAARVENCLWPSLVGRAVPAPIGVKRAKRVASMLVKLGGTILALMDWVLSGCSEAPAPLLPPGYDLIFQP